MNGLHRNQTPTPRGFTIAELLLSLAILASIGLAIAALLFAVSASLDGEQQRRMRSHVRQVSIEHVAPLFRSARRVLALDATRTVLWIADIDNNLRPRLSELCLLEWSPGDHEVTAFRAAADYPESLDTVLDWDADFIAQLEAVAGATNFPGQTLIREVNDWEVEPDAATLPEVRLVTVRYGLTNEPTQEGSIIVAALRSID